MTAQPITAGQRRAIFGALRARNLSKADLRTLVSAVTGRPPQPDHTGVATLTADEAAEVLRRLTDLPPQQKPSRRTEQWRRRRAGVVTLAGPKQLALIRALAAERRWTDDTLRQFCLRQCRRPRPRTAADANRVIEALKSMNRRDGLWHGSSAPQPPRKETPHEPA